MGMMGAGVSGAGRRRLGPRQGAVRVTLPRRSARVALLTRNRSQIVVEGNRRVEADTIRSYFQRPGALDAARISMPRSRRSMPPTCSRTCGSARPAAA